MAPPGSELFDSTLTVKSLEALGRIGGPEATIDVDGGPGTEDGSSDAPFSWRQRS